MDCSFCSISERRLMRSSSIFFRFFSWTSLLSHPVALSFPNKSITWPIGLAPFRPDDFPRVEFSSFPFVLAESSADRMDNISRAFRKSIPFCEGGVGVCGRCELIVLLTSNCSLLFTLREKPERCVERGLRCGCGDEWWMWFLLLLIDFRVIRLANSPRNPEMYADRITKEC